MHELGAFELTYPCWALVHKDSIVRDGAGRPTGVTSPIKLFVLDDSSGRSMFPLFTDGDLAARFKKASGGLDDFVIFAVKDAEMMADGFRIGARHRRHRDARQAGGERQALRDLAT